MTSNTPPKQFGAISPDDSFQIAFDKAVIESRNISSLFYPSKWEGNANFLGPVQDFSNNEIVPPDDLRHWYSIGDDGAYLSSGKYNAGEFRKLFEEIKAVSAGTRLAEVGCSSGRVVRWFDGDAKNGVEVWGIDIDSDSVKWAEQHIGSNIHFMVNTTHPHLPFEDRYFDFLYGNSLFTHIGELSTAWLIEMRRVLSKDGVAVFTFNDTASINWLKQKFENVEDMRFKNPKMLLQELSSRGNPAFSKIIINRSPWQQSVWYDQEYLKKLLSRWFDLKKVVDGFAAYQTAYVLTRKSRDE